MFMKTVTFFATFLVLQGCVQADAITDLNNAIQTFVHDNIITTTNLIQSLKDIIQSVIRETIGNIIGAGINGLSQIENIIGSLIGNISGGVAGIVNNVGNIAKNVTSELIGVITDPLVLLNNIFDQIDNLVGNATNVIKSVADNLFNKIESATEYITEKVGTCIKAQISNIENLITTVVNNTVTCIKSEIKSIIDDLKNVLDDLNGLYQLGKNAFNEVKNCTILNPLCPVAVATKLATNWFIAKTSIVAEIAKLVISVSVIKEKMLACVVSGANLNSTISAIVKGAGACL